MNKEEMIQIISEAAFEEKAEEALVMEVADLTILAEAFVLITGRNVNHNRSMADAIIDKLEEKGEKLLHNDGYDEGRWIVLDYGNVIVHLFRQEERDYYKLEKLWGDAPQKILQASQMAQQ